MSIPAGLLLLALLAGLGGCQGAKVSRGSSGGAGGAGGAPGAGGQSPPSPSPPILPPGRGDAGDASPVSGTGGEGGACAEDIHAAEQTPVDLLLLVDKSGSMIGPKWQMSSAALASFVQDPNIRGAGGGGQLLSRIRQRLEVHQRHGLRVVPVP